MKRSYLWLLAFALVLGYQCKEAKKETEAAKDSMEEAVEKVEEIVEIKVVKFNMEARSGSNVEGVVTFTEENGMVTMSGTFSNLSPGEHAIHLHEKADCSADDATSTGGHWNPTSQPHGQWGAESGYHKGDIGNFIADEEGNGEVTFSTDQWCLGCDDPNKNILGKAVIVHQGVDDFTSQPSGAAGARISCTGIVE